MPMYVMLAFLKALSITVRNVKSIGIAFMMIRLMKLTELTVHMNMYAMISACPAMSMFDVVMTSTMYRWLKKSTLNVKAKR